MDLIVLVILLAFLCVFYLQFGKLVTELGEIKSILQNQGQDHRLEDIGEKLFAIRNALEHQNERNRLSDI